MSYGPTLRNSGGRHDCTNLDRIPTLIGAIREAHVSTSWRRCKGWNLDDARAVEEHIPWHNLNPATCFRWNISSHRVHLLHPARFSNRHGCPYSPPIADCSCGCCFFTLHNRSFPSTWRRAEREETLAVSVTCIPPVSLSLTSSLQPSELLRSCRQIWNRQGHSPQLPPHVREIPACSPDEAHQDA